MCRHSVPQLLIRAHLCIEILVFWQLPSLAGELSDTRAASRMSALAAADNVDQQLDLGQAIVSAAISGKDPPGRPAASVASFPSLLDQIALGLALPPPPVEPSAISSTLPTDPDRARQMVAALTTNLVQWFDLIVVYAGEPAFASKLEAKLSSINKKTDELVESYARSGNQLGQEYASALGYDINDIALKYRPRLVQFFQLAHNLGNASRSADGTLRANSRPLLALASSFVREEGVLLSANKKALDQVTSEIAEHAQTLREESNAIAEAVAKNTADIDALLVNERVLTDSAEKAAERARTTGSEADRNAAKAAENELRDFREGMNAALENLNVQKTVLAERDHQNKIKLDQLSKNASSALARYQAYERRQTDHSRDEEALKNISF